MNYLKYNLKIKFRFNIKDNNKGYDFKKLFDDLKSFLIHQKMSLDLIFDGSPEFLKISKVYFETKNLVPQGAKPAFFERMFNEIIKLNNKQIKQLSNDNNNDISGIYQMGNLGTIKEENSVVEIYSKSNMINNINNHQSISVNYQKELNKIQLLSHLNKNMKKSNSITFNDIPQDIIIKHMLFFLDINSLPKFSMATKKTNECVKSHIFIRLYFLNKEKKLIEQENSQIINSVEEKRKQFYEEYEIEAPSKDHACQLMNSITSDDIIELKQCFKKYNKNYENIIAPLVLLLGGKAQSSINPDGTKTTSYFYPAQKMLNNKDFVRKLRELELETISHSRFKSVEKIIESPNFNIDKIKLLSPCLHHLLSWVMGKYS